MEVRIYEILQILAFSLCYRVWIWWKPVPFACCVRDVTAIGRLCDWRNWKYNRATYLSGGIKRQLATSYPSWRTPVTARDEWSVRVYVHVPWTTFCELHGSQLFSRNNIRSDGLEIPCWISDSDKRLLECVSAEPSRSVLLMSGFDSVIELAFRTCKSFALLHSEWTVGELCQWEGYMAWIAFQMRM